MSATLLSFARRRSAGWDNEELALLVRVQRLLAGAGLDVEMEHGVSEEGDPWCVFCNAGTGDVVVHIARIDGVYILDSTVLANPIEGRSLTDCADRFLAKATLVAPSPTRGGTLWIHPGAMLAGVLMTIMMFAQANAEKPAFIGGPDAPDAASDGAKPAWLKLMAQQIASFLAAQDRAERVGDQVAPTQNWVLLQSAAMIAALALNQDQKTLAAILFGEQAEGGALLVEAEVASGAALPEEEPGETEVAIADAAAAPAWTPVEEAAAETAGAEGGPLELARRSGAEAGADTAGEDGLVAGLEVEEQLAIRRGADILAGGEGDDTLVFDDAPETPAEAAAPEAVVSETPIAVRLVEVLLSAGAREDLQIAEAVQSLLEEILGDTFDPAAHEADDMVPEIPVYDIELSGVALPPPRVEPAAEQPGMEAAAEQPAMPRAYEIDDQALFMELVRAHATYGRRELKDGDVIFFHPGVTDTTAESDLLVIGYEHDDDSLSILITFDSIDVLA